MSVWHPINQNQSTPEKVKKVTKMSGTTPSKTKEKSTEGGLSEADTTFLVTCLQHTTGGSISIDTEAVAAILKFSNHRSVGNKIGLLKKKLNLPIGTGKVDGGASTYNPKTPSSDRVTKNRRKKITPTPKKAISSSDEGEEGDDGDDIILSPTVAKHERGKKFKKEEIGQYEGMKQNSEDDNETLEFKEGDDFEVIKKYEFEDANEA